MDFAFNEEQEMLRQQARSFLDKELGHDRVVEIVEWVEDTAEPGAEILERVRWPSLVELGWVGLSIPEDAGGAGMKFLDEAVLLEELGHALYPGPYFSTVALALPALVRAPSALERVLSGAVGATMALEDLDGAARAMHARQEGGAWRLFGEKALIPDLWDETLVVVAADTDGGRALFLVDVGGDFEGRAERRSTMDGTRRFGKLATAEGGTPATLLAGPEDAEDLLRRIRVRATAAAAVEAVGIGQLALDLALGHAKERTQFDKPIGSYQAVSHQVADMYMNVELARSLAYWAAWCVSEDDDQAEVAAAAAKAFATEAAVSACEHSIQVHGGIGFTWEHILHRYYKRAQWLEGFAGYGASHRLGVADALFAHL